MKRIFKSYTFWFPIASVAIIILNLVGIDTNNILLIYSNYPLHLFLKASGFTLYSPEAIDHTFYINNLFRWFFWHYISFVSYGLIVDIIMKYINKRKLI